MENFENQDWERLGPGYHQVKFSSFKQFMDYLYSDLLDFGTYVWRGHRREDWKLESTIQRLKRVSKTSHTQSWKFEEKHLELFKQSALGRRGLNPQLINDENEWWALGQHHGLATPLLDWSTSPFVASFFAFSEDESDHTSYRAIFALHRPTIERTVNRVRNEQESKRKQDLQKYNASNQPKLGLAYAALNIKNKQELIFIKPLSDENKRLSAQGGLFTRSRFDISIEDWVTKHHDQDDTGITLLKCLVPNQDRSKCLQLLNRMNINHLSLFPDLLGASQYCNLHYDIENY